MNKIFPLKIQMSFPLKFQALSFLTVIAFIVFSWSALSNSHLPIHKTRIFEGDSSRESQKGMKEREKGFFHGVDIIETDTETGIDETAFNTTHDDHRYTLGLFFNANLMKTTTILGGEFLYGYKFEEGSHFEIFTSFTNANLSMVSDLDNASSLSGTLLSGGLGFGLRSSLIQHFIDSKTLFETISGYLTYNQLSSATLAGPFVGPGLKATYGIHQRIGKTIHYGLKVAYDLASVRRPALDSTETTGDRALILTSLTFGLELTLYY